MSGEIELLKSNIIGAIIVTFYTAIVTYLIIKLVNLITPIRAKDDALSVDLDQHGELNR
ncbi:MAG: ammonium transporter [Alphaproteobacteria bacterium]|nr:ammonium transporter [Alphaproteobacteria bacterium]